MTPAPVIEPNAPKFLDAAAPDPAIQLDHLLNSVGVSRIDDLGWIRATGPDRTRWLNGMVTNSIQSLQPGQGNYSFVLSAQGQIQGDLNTFSLGEDFLLIQTANDQVDALLSILDRFIIMDDVELQDISDTRIGCAVAGPAAADLLALTGFSPPTRTTPEALAISTQTWRAGSVDVIAAHAPLVPRYELWTDKDTFPVLIEELTAQAAALDGGPVQAAALEHLRILEGTPRFGTDIRDKTLAQETAQTRALHFSKGCYLGQEIVERIRSRGNVHRTFAAFQFNGPLPPTGTRLIAEEKSVAELTSVASIPLRTGPVQLGLGLIRRENIERGGSLTYNVDSVTGTAVPCPIPIQQAVQTT